MLPPDSRFRQITAVSKSMMRAMQCETHFANHYLIENSPLRLIDSPLAKTGTDFHDYRAAYIRHLVAETDGFKADKPWATWWLKNAVVTEDAKRLIADDIDTFAIDPDAVYGAEIFLSISGSGDPLEMEIGNSTPGKVSLDPRAAASGSLDLLEIREQVATVVDYKSGWATATVSDFEPPVYAALVFGHFPQIEEVNFRWEFVRLGSEKNFAYNRSQLPELLDMILGALARARSILERFATGGRLTLDPWAGLCQYCSLRCPLREAAQSRQLLIPPVQSEDDARTVAAVLYAARMVAEKAAAALKPWLSERGQLALNADFVAELQARYSTKKPLLETLEVLGYDVSSMRGNSPAFDVPLEKLTLGGITTYAKAKKRKGLPEKLAAVSVTSATSILKIRRLSEGEQLLESASDEGENDAAA